MDVTVVVALIALVGTIASGIISAVVSARLTNYRIEQLEKKVDKHNNLIERMYKVEEDISLIKKDIDNLREGE